MPRRHVSRDLKARIPYLRYVEHFSVKEIERILGVRKTLIYDTLANYQIYGVTYNPTAYTKFQRGRPRKLDSMDVRFIQALLNQEPCMYLDELQDELMNRRNIYASVSTLLRTLRRLHFSRKLVSIKALERNDLERSAYMNCIGELITDPAQLIFIDEAARNKKNPTRKIGWSLLGKRCTQRRCFVRGQRFSILPALTLDGIITHDILPGSVTSKKFVQFLRNHVIPLTNPYPGPRSVIVLDNCNIHHADAVRELIEDEALCKLIFLPPYSPDLNPIEQAFSTVKAFLRRKWKDESLSVMDNACLSITPDMAWGFFKASGYVV